VQNKILICILSDHQFIITKTYKRVHSLKKKEPLNSRLGYISFTTAKILSSQMLVT